MSSYQNSQSRKGARLFRFTDNKIRKLKFNEGDTANQLELSDVVCTGLKVIISRRTGRKVYYQRIYLPNGKRVAIKIGCCDAISVEKARDIANRNKLAVAQGHDPRRRKKESEMTISRYGENYLEKAKKEKVTWRNDIAKITDISFFFGNKLLRDIKSDDIKRYLETVVKRTSTSTANHYRAILSKMFNNALHEELVEKNVVSTVRKYKEPESIGRALDEDETSRFLDALQNDHNRPASIAIELTLRTGMRKIECLSIKHLDIDLDKKQIHLRGSTTKNGEDRIIFLSHQALELIQEMKKYRVKRNPFLFAGRKTGQHLTSLRRTFARCKEKAHITGRLRLHDMRHSFCTTLARLGLPRQVMQSLMGHKTPNMIDRYTHLVPSQLAEATQLASDSFSITA